MIGSAPARSSTTAITMNGTSRYGQPGPLSRNRRRLMGPAASLTGAGAYGCALRESRARSAGQQLGALARLGAVAPGLLDAGGVLVHVVRPLLGARSAPAPLPPPPSPRSAKPAASSAFSSSVNGCGFAGASIACSCADLGERDVQQQRRVDLRLGVLEVGGDGQPAQDLVLGTRVDRDVERLDASVARCFCSGVSCCGTRPPAPGRLRGALGDLVQVGDHLRRRRPRR